MMNHIKFANRRLGWHIVAAAKMIHNTPGHVIVARRGSAATIDVTETIREEIVCWCVDLDGRAYWGRYQEDAWPAFKERLDRYCIKP